MLDFLFKTKEEREIERLDPKLTLNVSINDLRIAHPQAAALYLAYMVEAKTKYNYTEDFIVDMLKNQTKLGFENILRHQIKNRGFNSVSRETLDELLTYHYDRQTFYRCWQVIQKTIYAESSKDDYEN
jgi:hypothetical protein